MWEKEVRIYGIPGVPNNFPERKRRRGWRNFVVWFDDKGASYFQPLAHLYFILFYKIMPVELKDLKKGIP